MTDVFYKVTGVDGSPINGGTGQWGLPKGERPGKWMPVVPVAPCKSGYHVCTIDQLVGWLGGYESCVWLVECRGDHINHGDKHVFSQARLVRKVLDGIGLRLVVSDFAAHVAYLNPDPRVAAAIRAARDYANNEIDDAARVAASAAARDAASAADAAGAAASAAASDAARDAARAADAASAAASDAAWDAARDAARAADSAASAAAWAAASAARAAWDVAWAAERGWQARHLRAVIEGNIKPGTTGIMGVTA